MTGSGTRNKYAIMLKEIACLKIRLGGGSYGDMVREGLYASRGAARTAVQRALQKMYVEPTEQVRALEVARLEALTNAHWKKAIGGDIASTKMCVELSARKCRILGIDAPTKVDIVGILASLAEPSGLDPADLIGEAENILNQYQQHGIS